MEITYYSAEMIEDALYKALAGVDSPVYTNERPEMLDKSVNSFYVVSCENDIIDRGAIGKTVASIYIYSKELGRGIKDSTKLRAMEAAIVGLFPVTTEYYFFAVTGSVSMSDNSGYSIQCLSVSTTIKKRYVELTDTSVPASLIKIKELEATIAQLIEQGGVDIQPYLDQIASLEAEIVTQTQQHALAVQSLEAQISSLEEDINHVNAAHSIEIGELNQSYGLIITGLEGQISALQQDIIDLNNAHNAEVSGLEGQIDSLNGQIISLNASISSLEGQVLFLEGEKAILEGQVADLGQQVSTLEGEKSLLEAEVLSLNGDITDLNGQILSLQGQITTLDGQIIAIGETITSLNGQISVLESEVSSLEGQIVTLNGEISILQGEKSILEGQVASLQGDVSLLEAEVLSLEGQITTLNQEHQDAITDLNNAHQLVVDGLDAEISQLESEATQVVIAFQGYLDQISGEEHTNLPDVLESKSLIRGAIIGKGVDVVETATLRSYADRIAEIQGPDPGYAPPSDWPDISDVANDEIKMIVCDLFPVPIAFKVWGSASYTVDWGDGATENYGSGLRAEHLYTKGAGMPCSRGYTTFVVTVSSQGIMNQFRVEGDQPTELVTNLLGVKIGTETLTSLKEGLRYFCRNPLLEFVILPDSMPVLTDLVGFCQFSPSLRKLVLPLNMPKLMFANSLAAHCQSLYEIRLPTYMPSVQTLQEVFSTNMSIREIILPELMPQLSNMRKAFYDCRALERVVLPSVAPITDCLEAFTSCYSLAEIVNIEAERVVGAGVNFVNAFSGCRSLKNIIIADPIDALDAKGWTWLTRTSLVSIRFLNTNSTFSLASTISFAYTSLSRESLVTLFGDLPSVSGKNIGLTECEGAKYLTASDKLIITSKGWTIIG